jgi:DNA-binding MarR family transcriptional regulator
LANHNRLKLLALVFKTPGQTVTDLARQANLSLPVASQYLRALEARGLISARRAGRQVNYEPAKPDATVSAELISALRRTLQKGDKAADTIYKAATAFTHPRRVELMQVLDESHDFNELQALTGISFRAVWRHVDKLEARGFVERLKGKYVAREPSDRVGRELARMAAGNEKKSQ